MANFAETIKKVSTKNAKSKSKYLNANDSLIEILYVNKQELARPEIVDEMLELRLLADFQDEDNFINEVPDEDERFKIVEKMLRTCKNGIDTAISDSQNNSAFSYNEKYSAYKLEFRAGKYAISERPEWTERK